MKTTAIISQKGGAGKTTLALHLAVAGHLAGYDTGLIDLDPQGTAETWGGWRQDEPPNVIGAKAATLARTLDKAAKAGADLAVIDTPPLAQAEARAALEVADVVLVPCQLRIFDLDAIKVTAGLLKSMGKPAFVVFNRTPSRAPQLYKQGVEAVAAMGMQAAPMMLVERAAYHHAEQEGKAAQELDATSKAALEIAELWSWLCMQLAIKARK
ncbi:ParA family protein [Acidisphaera sp. L21]|uniref:ParA family protein n=1 Tax=Acidisphaera sp. L21 TaxID=1641851 RepID=UPI00131DB406|nr:ParA family protein [Acidisphaera sp. L21]